MPSYEHEQLIKRISQLDKVPENVAEYAAWIKAPGHLALLRDNAEQDELIIYSVSDCAFIHTVVVSENSLSPIDQDDLLRWSDPLKPFASYAYGGGKEGVWIERTDHPSGSKILENARQLVFGRNFECLKEEDASYYEILQEYSHLTHIHWRPEQHAYCRFDENGEFDHVVSITSKTQDGSDLSLVSFKREPLELYLAASNSALIRMFHFELLRRESFTDWPQESENVIPETNDFFYRQKIDQGKAAYTRGIQIIRPSRPKGELFSSLKGSWSEGKGRKYVEFVAWDWRNKRIAYISTDPSATTSYFQAQGNSLPLELSPAFFRPDVLLKYKGDSDKYTVEQRAIHCRGAWMLRDYDVNKAGQVHAYMRDLRDLPYQEQLYWKSCNEEPKAGISERAVANDFRGEAWSDPDPLENVLFIMRRWAESELAWWKLREEGLLEGISNPRTSSRDEWAGAFKDLSKLIIEGFQVKAIRKRLEAMNIVFEEKEQSLALMEKLLDDERKLDGLKMVQLIRSKIDAHSRGSTATDLANKALQEHGTYSAHFDNVCRVITDELKLIEQAFS